MLKINRFRYKSRYRRKNAILEDQFNGESWSLISFQIIKANKLEKQNSGANVIETFSRYDIFIFFLQQPPW